MGYRQPLKGTRPFLDGRGSFFTSVTLVLNLPALNFSGQAPALSEKEELLSPLRAPSGAALSWRISSSSAWRPGGSWATLSHEGLAGVQEDFAAFSNHPLDCQVLPNVFCFAHFVVHYPTQEEISQPETRIFLAGTPGWSTLKVVFLHGSCSEIILCQKRKD